MKDLTRTPLLSPRADMTEVQRWVNKIAVRGNFDWMPGVAGYSVTELVTTPYTLGATYDDIIKFTFTPRVKSRIVVAFQPALDCTVVTPVISYSVYTRPAPLASSLTDQVNEYDKGVTAFPAVSGRITHIIINSFDLAAGVTYDVIGRAKNAGTGTGRLRDPTSIIGIHFPLLTPAGQ